MLQGDPQHQQQQLPNITSTFIYKISFHITQIAPVTESQKHMSEKIRYKS